MTNDRTSTTAAALLAATPGPASSTAQSRRALVTKPVRVTVELQKSEYDDLGEFCRKATHESGAGRDVAKGHLLRVLFLLAKEDPTIADRLFERLLTAGPTRHRS